MGLFEKPKLRITELAEQISAFLVNGIRDEKIQELSQFGVDTSNYHHRMEILILGFYALNASLPQAISDSQKAYYVIDYTLQYMRALCEKLLEISGSEFEQTYISRVDEYKASAGVPQLNPVHEVGVTFAKHVGTTDARLILWASEIFAGYYQSNLEYLQRMDSKMNLVP